MFTLNSSFNDIKNNTSIFKYLCMFMPADILSVIPPEMHDLPMAQIKEKVLTPWGEPFISEQVVFAANIALDITVNRSVRTISVWNPGAKDFIPEADNSKNTACLFYKEDSGKYTARPAAIICPGGAYETVALAHEGFSYADVLENAGYKCFTLLYRTAPARYPEPQKDLILAIKHIRAHAENYGINPENILLIGSSAGGHLVSSTALYCEEIDADLASELDKTAPDLGAQYKDISPKPDKLCLCYPVINCISDHHEDSFINLTGGDESLREKLSVDLHVDSSYPKTFIWRCDDDELVPASNADRMYEALKKAGADVIINQFPKGGHGCGLADGTSAEGWIYHMIDYMK